MHVERMKEESEDFAISGLSVTRDRDEVRSSVFGFESFRPGQAEIIDEVVSGKSGVLAVMATGSGKSALFQIPAIMSDRMAIVVSPLIALMKDQVDALKSLGVAADLVNSSQTQKEQRETMSRVLAREVEILYVSPERFGNNEFMNSIRSVSIGLFAVDEAHCISSWGHDFRPSYSRLAEVIRKLRPQQVVALTATANERVRDNICESLGVPAAKKYVRGVYRDNMTIGIMSDDGRDRFRIIKSVVRDGNGATGIIYVATRKEAASLCKYLEGNGVDAAFYHAGLKDKDRKEIQEEWTANGGVVVATSAFGMGIDRADVRFVIHSGFTGSLEEWYQEIGRAGRDGEECICLSLFNMGPDYRMQMYLIDLTNPESGQVRKFWAWLRAVAGRNARDEEVKTATVEMTQKKMETASGVANVGACMSFLRRQGLVVTLGRGKYQVKLTDAAPNYEAANLERKEKTGKLNELVSFFKSGECRFVYVCRYFGDDTFTGKCGDCDNCTK
jgi:ATP-dependent DNA helicase RecQ